MMRRMEEGGGRREDVGVNRNEGEKGKKIG